VWFINNTPDPVFGQPIEIAAATWATFQVSRVENLQGFKAAALRLAMTNTASDADIIGVIDADYVSTHNG